MESSSTSVVAAVVVEHKKRQQRSIAEKRRIVEETLVPGASVSLVARTNGVNANLVFAWLRLYHAGGLIKKRSKTIQLNAACLLPVKVSEEGHRSEIIATVAATTAAQVRCAKFTDAPPGAIHIQFPKAQVRVEGSADASMLRVVLECLLR
jgi:transposase